MFNFLKGIFGLPPDDPKNIRFEDEEPSKHFMRTYEDNKDDIIRSHSEGRMNIFGFPVFSSPNEIHKYFDSLVDEMQRMFEFSRDASIMWEDNRQEISPDFNEQHVKPGTLRDSFLKSPGYISENQDIKQDVNLDGKVKIDDVENLLRNNHEMHNDQSSVAVYGSPKIYAKSVYIKTVRKPDGTVETIKKIQDHTGNEETIITQSNVSDNLSLENQQLPPKDDIPGLSILHKLFSF